MSRLPVDPDRCEHRRIEYSARDWDQTPRVVTLREIERLMPDISRIAANEITREADLNAIRTVHFNIMAAKEFVNSDFERLCQFIADFIELRLNDNQVRNAEQGLEEGIRAAVTLHATSMITKYKELDDIVQDSRDRTFIRAADTNLGRFNEIVRLIEDMHLEDQGNLRDSPRGRDDRGRDSRGRDDRGHDDRYSARDRYSQNETTHRYNREERYGTTSRSDFRERDDRYSSRDDRGSRFGGREEPRVSAAERSFSQTRQSDFPSQDEVKPREYTRTNTVSERKETPLEPEVKQIVEEHKLSITPVDDRPMFHGIHGSIPLLTPPKGMTEMQMLQHAAVYGSGIADAKDMSEEVIRVMTLAQAVQSDSTVPESIEKEVVVDENVKLFNNTASMVEDISTLATIKSIEASGENTDGVRKIFHTVAVVDNSFVGYQNLDDFQTNLAGCKDLRSILNFLKLSMHAVNTHASPESAYASDLRAAITFYDGVITKEINAYCRDVLRISNGDVMKSAMASLDDLINHQSIQSNQVLQSAIIGHLSTIAINILDCLDPKNSVVESIVGEVHETTATVGMSYLPQSYIVTHIPFTMKELGYEITEPVAIQNSDISNFLRAAIDVEASVLANDGVLAGSYRMLISRDRKAFRVYNYPGRRDVLILAPQIFN